MNALARLSDRDRVAMLERRVVELEEEIVFLRGVRAKDDTDHARRQRLATLRQAVRAVHVGAAQPAALSILLHFLDHPGVHFGRLRMNHASVTSRSRADPSDTDSKSIDVRLGYVRKALSLLGFPSVIHTIPDCGWVMHRADAARIKAAVGV